MTEQDFSATVMVGIDGTELSQEDISRLKLPAVGGVCLFARNYQSRHQLNELVAQIRKAADWPLVVAVDQEGGRVQRFGPPDFTEIPPAGELGELYEHDAQSALGVALERGELIARQLAESDIDLSFVPVLDLNYGRNAVIGARAFSSDPNIVAALGLAMCAGVNAAGMSAVGKHFPGHGWTAADTHADAAVDERSLEEIKAADILPFSRLIECKVLAAVMTTHVCYPAVDNNPATYSAVWIEQVLRDQLGFKGPVITDDLVMHAAGGQGVAARIAQAAKAGCDLFCVCGGEPVLADSEIAKLPVQSSSMPWRNLARRSGYPAGQQ